MSKTLTRGKALSSSQGDLVDGVDFNEYKSASNLYSLHELGASGNKLPLVIRINDGFYGKTDWTTISSDEIIFLYGMRLRKRVLATAEDGTRYSFPLDCPLLFSLLQPDPSNSASKATKSGKQKPELAMYSEALPVSSNPMSLKEILSNQKLPIGVVVDDAYVAFQSSNHDRETVHFGKLTLTNVYDEKYFVGNEIRNGNLSLEIALLPIFLRVKVRLVQGFAQKKNRKLSWKTVVAEWTSTASRINYDAVEPPSAVAAFEPDAVAKVAKNPAKFDVIEPNNYIKLKFLPAEVVDHTYEELPTALQDQDQTHEPSVSTFKLSKKPIVVASSRPAIPISELPVTDFDPYNQLESPITEIPSSFVNIKTYPDPPNHHHQQNLTLPGKRIEPRSYSPVPSPPTTFIITTRGAVPPTLLFPKPINRAPMPLPKSATNPETLLPVVDVSFVDSPPRIPFEGLTIEDRAPSLGSQLDSCGKNESPKGIRPDQRRPHPVVPLPPALKPSDLKKKLKPASNSIDLGMNSTSMMDMEAPMTSEEKTPPRKPKAIKPRSKTDLALSTSQARLLQQETATSQQDIKASEVMDSGNHSLPLPKYKAPIATKPNKVPFAKTRAYSPEKNNPRNSDSNTSLSSDYDDLLCTSSNVVKIPPTTTKVKQAMPLPPPIIDTNSPLPINETVVRAVSPMLPLPPPPVFFPTEYEFPSKESNPIPPPPPEDSKPNNVPKPPPLSFEKLPTKDRKDTIASVADIPKELDSLSCFHLADCLKLLNMDSYVKTFLTNQIDGKLLLELDEEILTSDLKVSKLHAKKLLMFAHRGWRP